MSRRLKVGDWWIEVERDRITRGNTTRHLRPQVMDLLLMFARRPGEVLSIDEILDALWPGKNVGSDSVYNTLKELRSALGDETRHATYIETIPRRGYSLLAPVRETVEPVLLLRSRGPGVITISLTLLLAAALSWLLYSIITPHSKTGAGPVIAVLPFETLDDEPQPEYISWGIAEDQVAALGRLPGIRVAGAASSFELAAASGNVVEQAYQAGITHVLAGSMQRHENRIRLRVSLIQTIDGQVRWTGEYDQELASLPEVQGRIARELAQNLTGREWPEHVAASPHLVQVDAYELYLLARHRERQYDTPDSLLEAAELLDRALVEQPDLTSARVFRVHVLERLIVEEPGYFGTEKSALQLWESLSEQLVMELERALLEDPDLAEAWAHMARVRLFNGDPDEASRLLEKAAQINPSLQEVYFIRSELLARDWYSGTEFIENSYGALRADPLSPENYVFLSDTLSGFPDHQDEAWSVLERLRSLPTLDFDLSIQTSRLLADEGKLAEAVQVLGSAPDGTVQSRLYQQEMSRYLYLLGEYDRARVERPDRRPEWADTLPGSDACHLPNTDFTPLELRRQAYTCLLNRQPALVIDAYAHYVRHPEQTSKDFKSMIGHLYSPAFLIAASLSSQNDPKAALPFIALEQKVLDIRYDSGKLRSASQARQQARLHALRGEFDQALIYLSKMLDFHGYDPRAFQNPVYDPVRTDAGFMALTERLRNLVNQQRQILGWPPMPDDIATGYTFASTEIGLESTD